MKEGSWGLKLDVTFFWESGPVHHALCSYPHPLSILSDAPPLLATLNCNPQEFAKIYELCEYILEHSQRPSLLNGTLQTLQRFLTWIPLGYIFERQLIE